MIFEAEDQNQRLKWAFSSCKNGAWGDEPDGARDAICIRAADFDGQLGRLNNGERTLRSLDQKTFDKIALRNGDIIIEKSGGGEKQLVGRAVIFHGDHPSFTSNFLARCRPADGIEPEYLNYLLLAIYNGRGTYPHLKQSTGIQNLDLASFLDIKVDIPPLKTQRRIAQFLDEKTARIDGLIEKKRGLLDLLAEKRQTLITRAVTKGLNPDAPMKPSGIDWLGDVPAHWEVMPIKRGIIQIEQGWSPAAEARTAAPDEWGVLKSGCVNDGMFDENSHKTLPAGIDPKPVLEVRGGDILMCRASGSLRFIGSVALVAEVRPSLMFSDKTYRISLDSQKVEKYYFVYSMAAKHMREQVVLSVSGAEGLANNIAQSSVGSYIHSFPPLSEQKAIAEYLENTTHLLERLKTSIEKSVRQLNEYRSSLITKAITGQIEGLA